MEDLIPLFPAFLGIAYLLGFLSHFLLDDLFFFWFKRACDKYKAECQKDIDDAMEEMRKLV